MAKSTTKESAKPAGPPVTSEDAKAKKDDTKKVPPTEAKEAAASEPKSKPSPEPTAPAKATQPERLVSFKRWFQARGFKPHWDKGMAAYTDTTVRRTMSEWDGVFKDY